jgi:hypothetical protein
MSDQPPDGKRDEDRRPAKRSGPGKARRPIRDRGSRRGSGPSKASKRSRGSIGLAEVGGGAFELVHPQGIKEVELDFEEGLELWKAGDPESARDALRYALSACHDNLWAHVALGRIALEEFRDPTLARGHFGYAVELGLRAVPPGFSGRLPRDRPNNRPFFDALEGLVECLHALGRQADVSSLRTQIDRLCNGPSRGSA